MNNLRLWENITNTFELSNNGKDVRIITYPLFPSIKNLINTMNDKEAITKVVNMLFDLCANLNYPNMLYSESDKDRAHTEIYQLVYPYYLDHAFVSALILDIIKDISITLMVYDIPIGIFKLIDIDINCLILKIERSVT